jgi:hypothetical protein
MHAATGENTNGSGVVDVNPVFMSKAANQLYQQDWFDGFAVDAQAIQTAMASKFATGQTHMFLEVEELMADVYAATVTLSAVAAVVADAVAVIKAISPNMVVLLTGFEHPQYFTAWNRGNTPSAVIAWNTEIKNTLLPAADGLAPYWYPPFPENAEANSDEIRRAFEANMDECLRMVGGSWQYPGKPVVPLIWWQYRTSSTRHALQFLSDNDVHRLIHALWTYKIRYAGVWMHFASTDYTPPGLTLKQATTAYTDFYWHRLPRLIYEARGQRSSIRFTASGPSNAARADN